MSLAPASSSSVRRTSQVRRRLHHARRNLRVEADAEPVVEPDTVDLPRVHNPDAPPDQHLERPPEVGSHPERLDVIVAAPDRQHPHNPIRPDARRRHLVHRPIPTDRHHQNPLRERPHDPAR
ncbi:MAG: hypothetical protein M3358_15350, partial [Actinomycetota bacterium]|nr:hypothetical protein [Actinomycetota bacterium]